VAKRVSKLLHILVFSFSVNIAVAQPPPPPPDPGNLGGTPHGGVGTSAMCDGYGMLLLLGLAYAGWRVYRIRKKKMTETQ